MGDESFRRVLAPFGFADGFDEVRKPRLSTRLSEEIREQGGTADYERSCVELALHVYPLKCAPGGTKPPGISPRGLHALAKYIKLIRKYSKSLKAHTNLRKLGIVGLAASCS